VTVSSAQRFTKPNPGPVCQGHKDLPQGEECRCYSFLSEDKEWAHCTRPVYAGPLEMRPESDSYAHKLVGDCRCGKSHCLPVNANGHNPQIVATYDYLDEKGRLLHQTVRYSPKNFKQRRPDGSGGWIWSLDGTPRVLYRLPELLCSSALLVIARLLRTRENRE
jgi:hypothetical protein